MSSSLEKLAIVVEQHFSLIEAALSADIAKAVVGFPRAEVALRELREVLENYQTERSRSK